MTASGLAFFDLDHTLLDGDSDSSFIEFLGERGILTRELVASNDPIGEAYMQGHPWEADYRVFLRQVYEGRVVSGMRALAEEHATTRVVEFLYPGARALVEAERAERQDIALLTTTNQLVSTPIASVLGIDAVLSTQLEVVGDRYTGELVGAFCTGPGKARALRAHCRTLGVDPADCAMFGDGRSDMDALAAVGEPVAVHPTDALERHARERGWRVLDLSSGVNPPASARGSTSP